ncbi:MAG: DNA-3-methyladenine glycosylase, partial [Patescibacteria group bacterium]
MPNVCTLNNAFFNRPTLHVAQEILGKFLVCKKGSNIISAMITEVEAYVGPEDRASHASRGRTPRTEVMFEHAGHWYVYFIYGMHYCVNIVTEQKNYPAAILIRGVEGVSGPGRVAKYFSI